MNSEKLNKIINNSWYLDFSYLLWSPGNESFIPTCTCESFVLLSKAGVQTCEVLGTREQGSSNFFSQKWVFPSFYFTIQKTNVFVLITRLFLPQSYLPNLPCNRQLIPTFFFFFFLGPHPQHLEVPRLGV